MSGRLSQPKADEYSMKEDYKRLMSEPQIHITLLWPRVWDKKISSKMSGLVRKMLYNRIPTNDNFLEGVD